MKDNFFEIANDFWQVNVIEYINSLSENPFKVIALIVDLTIVIFLIYNLMIIYFSFKREVFVLLYWKD